MSAGALFKLNKADNQCYNLGALINTKYYTMLYYVKSFEEDFYTKTILNNKKTNFQSLGNVIKTRTLKPNTRSFGQKQRLSTTILHKNYTRTYRPQGIIFTTNTKPDHVLPFDLVLLSDAKKIIVHYFRIKNNIHLYYNHNLINGFGNFIFKDFEKLIKKFPNINDVWRDLNNFRIKSGHKRLPTTKRRLIEYNEAVFYKSINIHPVAIFGYKKEVRVIAKKYKLPYFRSAKEFFEDKTNINIGTK